MYKISLKQRIKNMTKKNVQIEAKDTSAEQRDLSLLLCKMLYTIYKKQLLEIDTDNPSVVTAYTTDETRLYDIWRETFYDKTTYWLRVQNGERRMVEFGRFPNDGTIFNNNEHDYLEALYNLRKRRNYVKKRKPTETAIKTKLALVNLESQKPTPDLNSFDAWNEDRMKVLIYLKGLLRNKQ